MSTTEKVAENGTESCAPCGSPLLTAENYKAGFLVDEELMAGIGEEEGRFFAYVLRHSTGEYLGYQTYSSLDEALQAVNRIERSWTFERLGGCGGGNCEKGDCKKGKCGLKS